MFPNTPCPHEHLSTLTRGGEGDALRQHESRRRLPHLAGCERELIGLRFAAGTGRRTWVYPRTWVARYRRTHGAPMHLVQQTLGRACVTTTGKYLHARHTVNPGVNSRGSTDCRPAPRGARVQDDHRRRRALGVGVVMRRACLHLVDRRSRTGAGMPTIPTAGMPMHRQPAGLARQGRTSSGWRRGDARLT